LRETKKARGKGQLVATRRAEEPKDRYYTNK